MLTFDYNYCTQFFFTMIKVLHMTLFLKSKAYSILHNFLQSD